jgi:hypothetical protein
VARKLVPRRPKNVFKKSRYFVQNSDDNIMQGVAMDTFISKVSEKRVKKIGKYFITIE